jgi:hypothetical protein
LLHLGLQVRTCWGWGRLRRSRQGGSTAARKRGDQRHLRPVRPASSGRRGGCAGRGGLAGQTLAAPPLAAHSLFFFLFLLLLQAKSRGGSSLLLHHVWRVLPLCGPPAAVPTGHLRDDQVRCAQG